MVESRHRRTVRVLVVDPQQSFLMFYSKFDPGVDLPPRWIFPGGGIESDESEIQAAIRELFEETGLVTTQEELQGPHASFKFEMESKHEFDTGEATFFSLQIPERFEPSHKHWTEAELRDTLEHRWLTLDEIRAQQLWVGPDGALDFLSKHFDPAANHISSARA